MKHKIEILSAVGLFQSLSEQELASVATRTTTRELASRNELFHKGDQGSQVYVVCSGRLKILTTSRVGTCVVFNTVGPGEVEDALRDHPGVAEVAVVGIVDPQWGEVVCAVIVAASGGAPTLDELSVHCEGRLARFKRPRRLEVVEALPRTAATGQVQRSLLVERILASG